MNPAPPVVSTPSSGNTLPARVQRVPKSTRYAGQRRSGNAHYHSLLRGGAPQPEAAQNEPIQNQSPRDGSIDEYA